MTGDSDALFTTCLQDLAAGERMLGKALPGIAECAADERLQVLLLAHVAACRDSAAGMANYDRDLDGPDNLWMTGICDDARRDTETTKHGPLLDTALIGAIRKATGARAVSYDTAIAMAEVLAIDPTALIDAKARSLALDQALLALLPGTAALGKSAQTSS